MNALPLSERRPSWLQQGGHYFFRLWSLSLSRKASNAITKLPKAISKPITPMNIKMISAAVIGATSLPMYSGKPVIGSGGYHPCHGFHEWILPYSKRNFNRIRFEAIKVRTHFTYRPENIQRQYGDNDKKQVPGSSSCCIRKIFIKIRFQSVQDRVFHV